MRPYHLHTDILLDSANPQETTEALELLGFLDGQTTNPSLLVQHPDLRERFQQGERWQQDELEDFYRDQVKAIAKRLPEGELHVQVYTSPSTVAEEMVEQAQMMVKWAKNARIKLPMTIEGLTAAEMLVRESVPLNLTLCMNQNQAIAAHIVARAVKEDPLCVSVYVERLEKCGTDGIQVLKNVVKMCRRKHSYVNILAASIHSVDQFMGAIAAGADAVTAPLSVLQDWAKAGKPLPEKSFVYKAEGLEKPAYKKLKLPKDWRELDLSHPLTTSGVKRFAEDWAELTE